MKFRAAPVVETERLRLRAHRIEDFEPIYAMMSDPDVVRHISGPQPREEAWRRMLCGPGLWPLLGYGYWIVERRENGALIGQAGLADFKRDMVPRIEGLPELGYVFSSAARGQGYASEAAAAIIAWADRELSAPELVAIIDPANHASIRVAEKNGFAIREPATYKDAPILLFRRRA